MDTKDEAKKTCKFLFEKCGFYGLQIIEQYIQYPNEPKIIVRGFNTCGTMRNYSSYVDAKKDNEE